MISVGEASARILKRVQPLDAEPVQTGQALDRVLADVVVAPITSPPWTNSSMDGYAVQSTDIVSGDSTAQLRVVETVAAGKFPTREIHAGEAIRVMTGAPVPRGADSVVRREDTDEGREIVTIVNKRDAGKNIRQAGEDFRKGDVLFHSGEVLSARHLGVLASAGIQNVNVHRAPRVALISSGDELVELEDFTPGHEGQKIVSANTVTLSALSREAGALPLNVGIASDDPESLREKLRAAQDCDMIVTSAGISVGDHDHVREVFAQLGGELDFWKVRMRPGAPLAFGMLNGTPWIGLSGNPVSAVVTFELFVRPAIRKMLGHTDVFPVTLEVELAEPITLAAPLLHFLRVVIRRKDDGAFAAELAGSQSSSVLTALARANALLVIPGDPAHHRAGEKHRAIPLGRGFDSTRQLILE